MDLVRSMIVPEIYAVCALLSFVSTGADVSFPLIAALSAYISVMAGNAWNLGVVPVFLIAILTGCLIGCINGFLIVKYRFNSLIVTLGTSSICSGILFGAFEAGRTELPENAGLIFQTNMPDNIALGCLAALCTGALCGTFNGILISRFHIPPMLATLGSYELFMGISVVLSGGSTVSVNGEIELLSSLTILNIPLPFIIFILCTAVLAIMMGQTKFGMRTYLVGTSDKAAKFAGIHVNATIIKCYMMSGLLAGVAGLISLSRLSSAKADFGTSYTMQTILVAVLGGINPNGGAGKMSGIAFAVIILQLLSSYLNQFPAISNYYRDLIWGAALLLVLVFNVEISRRSGRKKY